MIRIQFRFVIASILSALLAVGGLTAAPAHADGYFRQEMPNIVAGLNYGESVYQVIDSTEQISEATLITEGPGSFGDRLPTGIYLNSDSTLTGVTSELDYASNVTQGQICISYVVTNRTTWVSQNAAGCFTIAVTQLQASFTLPTSLTINNQGVPFGSVNPDTGLTTNIQTNSYVRLTARASTGTLTLSSTASQLGLSLANGTDFDVAAKWLEIEGTVQALNLALGDMYWNPDADLAANNMSPDGSIAVALSAPEMSYDPIVGKYMDFFPSDTPFNKADALDLYPPVNGLNPYLAQLHSESEMELASRLADRPSWMAGGLMGDPAIWHWDDGPTSDVGYISDANGTGGSVTYWLDGEPNGGGYAEPCLAFHPPINTQSAGWADYACDASITGALVQFGGTVNDNQFPVGTETLTPVVANIGIAAQERPEGPYAVRVEGDSFLAGQYVEVGVASNGRFGTDGIQPNGFHSMDPGGVEGPPVDVQPGRIGFVSDRQKDGWGVGYDDGDFFVPGDPFEGWGLEVNGSTFFNDDGKTEIGKVSQDVAIMSDGVKDIWTSDTSDSFRPQRDGIRVTQETVIPYTGQSLDVTVTIRNVSSEPIDNIYYSRQVDPDNGVFVMCGSNFNPINGENDVFATVNTIVGQASINGASLVSATAPDTSENCQRSDFSEELGNQGGSYLALVSTDSRSKVGLQDLGFESTSPSEFINAPLANDFVQSCPYADEPQRDPYVNNVLGLQVNCDSGIGIGFNVGSLAPGEYTDLHFSYILSEEEAQTYIDNNVDPVAVPNISSGVGSISGDYGQFLTATNLFTSTGGPIDYFTVSPTLPAGLTLNPQTGEISGTPTTSITDNPYTLTAHNFSGSDSVEFTLSITGLPLEWVDSIVAPMTANEPYSDSVLAFGEGDITYRVKPGTSLPAGLELNGADGALSGTPTEIGYYDFVIIASTQTSEIETRIRGNVFTGSLSDPKLVTGPFSVCVISSDRALSCMGTNDGNNLLWANNQSEMNGSLAGLSGSNQTTQLAGLVSTSLQDGFGCGIDDQAAIVCWGGQASNALSIGLGDNTQGIPDYSVVNKLTHDVNAIAIEGAQQVETLPTLSCAIVGATDGVSANQVDCWGTRSGFQSPPVPLVIGGNTIVDVADIALFNAPQESGVGEMICVVGFDTEVDCYSIAGDTYGTWAPVGGAVEVVASGEGVCFLAMDSVVECWNASGTSETIPSPLQMETVPALDLVVDIAATTSAWGTTFCAISQIPVEPINGQPAASGTVSCWGSSLDGTGREHTVPVKLEGASNITQISGGYQHMCLMSYAYDVYCIGQNMSWIAPTVPGLWNGQPVRVGTADQGRFVTSPSTVRNVEVTEEGDELTIYWDEPYTDGGSPIFQYSVYFIGPNGLNLEYGDSCQLMTSLTDLRSCTFELPPAGSDYQFMVYAVNREGASRPVVTLPSVVNGGGGGGVEPIFDVIPSFEIEEIATAPGRDSGSIRVNYDGAVVPGATGFYVELDCSCISDGPLIFPGSIGPNAGSFVFDSLPLGSTFRIRVGYYSDAVTMENANFSEFSELIYLDFYEIPSPTNVSLNAIPGTPTDTSGMAQIGFNFDTPVGDTYDVFTVEAAPHGWQGETITVHGSGTPITITGMEFNKDYDIRVRGTSFTTGTSEWSEGIRRSISPVDKYVPVLPKIAVSVKQAKTFKIAAATSQKLVVKVTSKTKATCTVTPIKVKKKVTGYLVKAAKLKKGKKSAVCSVLVSVTGNATYSTITNRQVNLTVKK